jgi:hypothetical protein
MIRPPDFPLPVEFKIRKVQSDPEMTPRRKISSSALSRTPIHKSLLAWCWVNYLKTATAFLSFIFQHYVSKHEVCRLLTQIIFPCDCDCITDRQLILFDLLLGNNIFCYNNCSWPGCGWFIVRDCGLRLCFSLIYPHFTAAKLNVEFQCQRHNM